MGRSESQEAGVGESRGGEPVSARTIGGMNVGIVGKRLGVMMTTAIGT
jgi:hypothetical protein